MNQGIGGQLVGGIVVVGLGVIAIAAIYQLQHPAKGTPSVASDATSITNNTLGTIFK